MNWIEVSSHRQRAIMDEWIEYLCVRSSPEGDRWVIGICCHNDEGDLAPMTDDSISDFSTISERAIETAISALGWLGEKNIPHIIALCRS